MDYLDFIQNSWKLIALTWYIPTQVPEDTLYLAEQEYAEKYLQYVITDTLPDVQLWSCLYMHSFIASLFNIPIPDNIEDFLPVSYDSLDNLFEKGYVYFFKIYTHDFVVIWDHNDNIAYLDYFGDYREGDDTFHLERTNKDTLKSMVRSYLTEDFETFSRFHNKTDDSHARFMADYVADYFNVKDEYGENNQYIRLAVNKSPILNDFKPTIQDVKNTVAKIYPKLDNEVSQKVYDYFLNKLLK